MKHKKHKLSSFTLIVIFLCLALPGVALLPLLPVKLSPSHTIPQIWVTYQMPGNPAHIVEKEVTSTLESMFARIRGVKRMDSKSGNGWGYIALRLNKSANMELLRFEVATVVRQAWSSMPEGVSYPSIQMKTPEGDALQPFLIYTINSSLHPVTIKKYVEDHIEPHLSQLPLIYKTDINGATSMEWKIEYDNEQLKSNNISLNEIRQAISTHINKEFLGNGIVYTEENERQWIRLILSSTPEIPEKLDLDQILINNKNGKLISLSQLVKVHYTEETPQSYYRINGLNSIYLSITANPEANQLSLYKQIDKEIKLLTKNLPEGYEIAVTYNASEYIQKELNKIWLRSGLTLLILLLFIFFLTRNWSYLIMIMISLTVNLLIAVSFYYWLNLEIQLYSLAGIIISLTLIIDNVIVMTNHILYKKNLKAYFSILAATLTTICALSIIFFLEENIRLNLQDFAIVVIINLFVSLFIALFFIPSLIDKLQLKKDASFHFINIKRIKWLSPDSKKRMIIYANRFYYRIIHLLYKRKVIVFIVLILSFGLPVSRLPETIKGDEWYTHLYNKTLGSPLYKEKIKPVSDKIIGGTLRLFTDKVYEKSYLNDEIETVLMVNATLPNGSTLEQMNTLIRQMEEYLAGFREISQFQTSIYNARRAHIKIHFKEEYEHSEFPYQLKSKIISKAILLGGGSWNIYGLKDSGFTNSVSESAGSLKVKLTGYNYEQLYIYAEELKEKLLQYRRINDITINTEFTYWKDDYSEFYMELDKKKLIERDLNPNNMFYALYGNFTGEISVGNLNTRKGAERIKLLSSQSVNHSIWDMQHIPYSYQDKIFKLSDLSTITIQQEPQEIVKSNQQYQLCIQYEYIGTYQQGKELLERELEIFNESLPMGYKTEMEGDSRKWDKKDNQQYLLLFLIIAIIFIITSILFNSLRLPLAIIFIIPISYIGVFLTFYSFELNFNQGGFASFILLCGLTVNASIYILSEYKDIRKAHPALSSIHAYIKAWNTKFIPIFLTIISTVLGFIPFLIADQGSFWYTLAIGMIGGLLTSFIGIYLFLPLLVIRKKEFP